MSLPTAKFMSITPQIAQRWLDQNGHNRRKRDARIREYAKAMSHGLWVLTHQGIAFGADGVLYDGQHRLEAIVNSGATVTMLVVQGLGADARRHIDDGLTRSGHDNYRFATGLDMSSSMSSTLRVLWAHESKGGGRGFSADEVERTMERHRLGMACVHGGHTPHRRERALGRAGVSAAFVYAYPAHPDIVEKAYVDLWEGAGLGSDDPIWVLREALLRTASASGFVQQDTDFRLSLTALRARAEGITVKRLLKVSDVGIDYFDKRRA